MKRTAKIVGVAAVGVVGMTAVVSPSAHATSLTKYAWFSEVPPASLGSPAGAVTSPVAFPSSPAGDPSGSLVVGGAGGQPTAISALEYTVDAGTPGATLTLKFAQSQTGAPAPTIDACFIPADTWSAGGAQSSTAAPSYSCNGAPTGTVSSDGTSISFTLGPASGTTYDIALVPDAKTSAFTTSFSAPDASSLTPVAAPSSSSDPGTPTPDTAAPTAPAPSASSSSAAPAATASSPAPAAGAADPSQAVVASGAAASTASAPGGADASATPAVPDLPATGALTSADPTTGGAQPAPASPGSAATPSSDTLQPASAATPGRQHSQRYLVGAVGLGLLILALMYGATRPARAPKLLGSVSIGSLKKSAED